MTEIELELTFVNCGYSCKTKNAPSGGYWSSDDMVPIRLRMGDGLGRFDYIRMCEVIFREVISVESTKHTARTYALDSMPLLYTGKEYILKEDTTIRVTCKQPEKNDNLRAIEVKIEIDLFEVFKALAYLVSKDDEIHAYRSNVSFFQKGNVRVTFEKNWEESNITFQTIPEKSDA